MSRGKMLIPLQYSKLSYELNDSAYSLSEMQNMQQLHASYNYNHHKYLAKQKEFEAKIAWLISSLVIVISVLLIWSFFKRYYLFRNIALDYRLRNANITRRLHQMAKNQPVQYPTFEDWKELRSLVEKEIPTFYQIVHSTLELPLSDMEYDVCLATRVQLSPIEISKLKQCSPANITKTRKKLLQVVFKKDGNSEDFDDEILKIGAVKRFHFI